MGDLKRRRSFYEQESPQGQIPGQASGLKSRYSKTARDIARLALLIQGTGRPIKAKELYEALGLEHAQGAQYINEANQFLKEQFCLDLFSLKSVLPTMIKSSPARDEYVLVSMASKRRSLLAKMYPEHNRKDYGLMLFLIIVIVLKDDIMDFDEIYAAFIRSHLHVTQSNDTDDVEAELDSSEELRIKESLRASLARLTAMRAFVIETVSDPVSHEKIKKYRIGPYAHAIIDANTLMLLILRLHFPQDKEIISKPEGHEKFKSVRSVISAKISNFPFKRSSM